ncbi:predicted protein [Plenodomus lingam JN3]|uniref:Predicted protein n=1 Tax=Leptosphaeria maculans (strain JN3 / isolate v23.1.3 / race Av1-4-5-6-7-8) TaxID=985895 RepID=E4ZSG4_LEPMJ|nr:predicted protein [Plenodomus lingam JN3]CBX94344.1 predicted protein [Plenodomus lingam JN3]
MRRRRVDSQSSAAPSYPYLLLSDRITAGSCDGGRDWPT